MKWLLIILLFISFFAEAQKKQKPLPRSQKESFVPRVQQKIQTQSQVLIIFRKVEESVRTNTVNEFESYLDVTVSIAIGTEERGYFSKGQAASILSNYFSGRRSISFEFSSVNGNLSAPYATGRFVYIVKGNQESSQIYVSLSYQENRWVISQFNIY